MPSQVSFKNPEQSRGGWLSIQNNLSLSYCKRISGPSSPHCLQTGHRIYFKGSNSSGLVLLHNLGLSIDSDKGLGKVA